MKSIGNSVVKCIHTRGEAKLSNDTIRKAIVAVSFLIGLVVYAWQIITAGLSGTEVDPAVTALITGVGAALATNFGAFMGISWNQTGGLTGFNLPTFKLPTAQALGALFYFLMLLLAAVLWLSKGLSPDAPEIIRNQVATLGGVIIGVVVVILNTEKP